MISRPQSRPAPGHFIIRLVKGGPEVPARIFRPDPVDPDTGEPIDRWPRLQVQIGTRLPTDDFDKVSDVWEHGRFISEAEYRLRRDQVEWDERFDPGSPGANPHRRVDKRALPPAF